MGGNDFEDLDVYKHSRELRKQVYSVARALPQEEKYNLSSQMRRAALSVTNNIAEGHGNYTFKHYIAYLYRARGSVLEIRDDLNACEDCGYLSLDRLKNLRALAARVTRLLNGYIRYLRNQQASKSTFRASPSIDDPSGGVENDVLDVGEH